MFMLDLLDLYTPIHVVLKPSVLLTFCEFGVTSRQYLSNSDLFLIACCRLGVRMSIVSFYPRATEKTTLIYRNLSKKDLKYTLCLITMMYIASLLIRDIG